MKILLTFLLVDLVTSMKILAPHNPTRRRFSREPHVVLENYGILNDVQPEEDVYDPRFRTHHVFENEFVSKNGSDYILFRGLTDVVFACRARYPVAWTVTFPKQVLHLSSYDFHITDHRSSVFIPEEVKPHNKLFESILVLFIPSLPFLSANFTCQSLEPQHNHKTSIYVYELWGDYAIENQGKTVQLPVDYNPASKDEDFVLPCRPTSPRFTVVLEKQTLNGTIKTFTEIIGHPQYLSFDPKIGFTMSKRLLGKNLFGLYRCRVDKTGDNDNEIVNNGNGKPPVVYLNVTMETPPDNLGNRDETLAEFKPSSNNEGNASVLFEGEDNDLVLCCSGEKGIRPETLNENCNGASQCEIMKQIIMEKATDLKEFGTTHYYGIERGNCSSIYMAPYWTSSVVYCKVGGLNYQQHYVQVFKPNLRNLEKRLEKRNETSPEKYIMKFITADNLPSLHLQHKIFISVGHSEPYSYYNNYGDSYFEDNFQLFDSESWQLLGNSHFSNIEPQYAQIREYDRNHYFTGEKLIISCFSLPLLYSTGSQLKIHWRNGSATILPTVNYESVSMYFAGNVLFSADRGVSINRCFSKEIEAHLEMESVECFVPQWGVPDWEVFKYELDVRPAVLPEVEVEEESVNLKLFDQDAEIIFKVNGGQPLPKIVNVFKDNKLIEGRKIIRKGDNKIGFQTTSEGGQGLHQFNVTFEDDTLEAGNTTTISDSTTPSYSVHIVFPNVTHDIQGVYRCTAENIKGNTTGTIHVYVTERTRHSKATLLLLGLTLMLGLLLVGIGIWYKCQHNTVQTLRFGIRRL